MRVDLPFMQFTPPAAVAPATSGATAAFAPGATAASAPAAAPAASPPDAFNAAVRRWLGGGSRVLPVRSPMGSGKSAFLDALLSHVFSAAPGTRVLVVTYRQSLASEHSARTASYLTWMWSPAPTWRTVVSSRA